MIKKRSICILISILLICTALISAFKINYYMTKSLDNVTSLESKRVINTEINENKYKYCDIIKITSKYGVKIKKVFYKDNIWDIIGVVHGNINAIRQYVSLLQKDNALYDIKEISGNADNINLELEIKIK